MFWGRKGAGKVIFFLSSGKSVRETAGLKVSRGRTRREKKKRKREEKDEMRRKEEEK